MTPAGSTALPPEHPRPDPAAHTPTRAVWYASWRCGCTHVDPRPHHIPTRCPGHDQPTLVAPERRDLPPETHWGHECWQRAVVAGERAGA